MVEGEERIGTLPVRALPFDTIERILNRAKSAGDATAYVPSADSPVSSEKVKGSSLDPNIVTALEQAKRDKALIDGGKLVSLQFDDAIELSGWCRACGLDDDAAAVDVAFR